MPAPALLSCSTSCVLKADVAAFAAKAEQYVGVTCGGMDQASGIDGRDKVSPSGDKVSPKWEW